MEINRDGDGFLLSLDDWSEEVMYEQTREKQLLKNQAQ